MHPMSSYTSPKHCKHAVCMMIQLFKYVFILNGRLSCGAVRLCHYRRNQGKHRKPLQVGNVGDLKRFQQGLERQHSCQEEGRRQRQCGPRQKMRNHGLDMAWPWVRQAVTGPRGLTRHRSVEKGFEELAARHNALRVEDGQTTDGQTTDGPTTGALHPRRATRRAGRLQFPGRHSCASQNSWVPLPGPCS